MIDELYHKDLLRLAAEATGAGKLEDADATVTLDNPMCGDRVTMQVKLDDGRIAALAHDVRACMLCQASASMVGAHAVGRTLDELKAVEKQVGKYLKEETTALPEGWPELSSFAPAAPHKSRHTCVLLPFRSLEAAMEEALTVKEAGR